jgi:hypothetical protein
VSSSNETLNLWTQLVQLLKTGNENGEPFTTEAPLVPSEAISEFNLSSEDKLSNELDQISHGTIGEEEAEEDTLEQRNIKEGQEEEEEETQQVGMSIHTYIQFLFIHLSKIKIMMPKLLVLKVVRFPDLLYRMRNMKIWRVRICHHPTKH